ncbi:MAG: hypothetical protein MUF84_16825 [Anaerolineae bacterium]|nr:hypothetical protein [Anaerolineae bacterium]
MTGPNRGDSDCRDSFTGKPADVVRVDVPDGGLFCLSPSYRAVLSDVSTRVAQAAERAIHLVEAIALPESGQWTVLRFGLDGGEAVSYAEGDALEVRLREAAGPDFWAALEAASFHERPPDVARRLIRIDAAVPADVMRACGSEYAEAIRADALKVRAALGLPAGGMVYEIEVPFADPGARPVIRVVLPPDGAGEWLSADVVSLGGAAGEVTTVVTMPYDRSYVGCVKAYALAAREHRALLSTIARFEPVSERPLLSATPQR